MAKWGLPNTSMKSLEQMTDANLHYPSQGRLNRARAETEFRFVGVDGRYFFQELEGMALREAISFLETVSFAQRLYLPS